MVQYSGTISVPAVLNALSVHNAQAATSTDANAISVNDALAAADYTSAIPDAGADYASAIPDAGADYASAGANALVGATTLPFGVGLRLVHLPIRLHKISFELRQLLLL